jgi:hypothetical protein
MAWHDQAAHPDDEDEAFFAKNFAVGVVGTISRIAIGVTTGIGTGVRLPDPHCRQAPWRQLRVAHRVGDRGMAKEVLD